MARIVNTEILAPIVSDLVMKACYELDEGFLDSMRKAESREESPIGREMLNYLLLNADYAKKEQIACCQDTGVAVVLMEIGQEVAWEGQCLKEMINEGVRRGYRDGYLRKSMVKSPLERINTGDNTPAVLHTEIVPGDKIKLTVMPKGGGSENMSRAIMLTPADGLEAVKSFVLETVELAGGNPCPPIIVGVGLGGTMDYCAWLAKKALLRPVGDRHPDKICAELELDLLELVNGLGIGPLGFGGRTTALDVHIETYSCHIAALPVAVNLQCHANRQASVII